MEKNKKYIIIAFLILGIVLVIFGTVSSSKGEAYSASAKYERELEARIEEMCISLEGIDKAKAFVTFEGETKSLYASSIKGTSFRSEGEVYPRIRGVAVLVTDGDKAHIKKAVTSLLTSSLGISSNHVAVEKGK